MLYNIVQIKEIIKKLEHKTLVLEEENSSLNNKLFLLRENSLEHKKSLLLLKNNINSFKLKKNTEIS